MIDMAFELQRGAFRVRGAITSKSRVTGLFGPSGAGKTSILLAVAGLIKPARGHIVVGGERLFDSRLGIHRSPESRRTAVVFQDGRLFPHLSVAENLGFARPSRHLGGVTFEEVVQLLDLEPLLARAPREISGGEARRVAIGRALLSHPRLLILDEPLAGLDPRLRRRVLAYLLRLKESLELQMLYVSHTYSDFLALVDTMAIIRDGQVMETGTPEELMALALGEAGSGPVTSTLHGEVVRAGEDLVTVECEGVLLELGLVGAVPGDRAYVTINSQDILLLTGDPPRSSARNCLPGRVGEVRRTQGRVLVAVDVGPRLWVDVTETAVEDLGLKPGILVHALIKARALRAEALHGRM